MNKIILKKSGLYKSFSFFLCCIILTYFISFIPSIYLPEQVFQFYGYIKEYRFYLLVVYFLLVFIFYFLVTRLSIHLYLLYTKIGILIYKNFSFFYSPIFLLTIELLFICFSIYNFIKYGINIRHSTRIVSSGSIRLFELLFYNYILSFSISTALLTISNKIKLPKSYSFVFNVGILSLLISSRSSIALLTSLALLFSRIYFIKSFSLLNELRFLFNTLKLKVKSLAILFLTFLSAIAVVLFGFANKSNVYLMLALNNLDFLYKRTLVRIGSHGDSLYNLIVNCYDRACIRYDFIEGLISKLNFFFDSSSYLSSDIVTSARINFLNTFSEPYHFIHPISGSSPGLIASIFITKSFVLSFVFIVLITSLFIVNLSYFISLHDIESINTIMSFLLYYIYYYFFLSDPLIYLSLFTPSIVFLFTSFFFIGFININFLSEININRRTSTKF